MVALRSKFNETQRNTLHLAGNTGSASASVTASTAFESKVDSASNEQVSVEASLQNTDDAMQPNKKQRKGVPISSLSVRPFGA